MSSNRQINGLLTEQALEPTEASDMIVDKANKLAWDLMKRFDIDSLDYDLLRAKYIMNPDNTEIRPLLGDDNAISDQLNVYDYYQRSLDLMLYPNQRSGQGESQEEDNQEEECEKEYVALSETASSRKLK